MPLKLIQPDKAHPNWRIQGVYLGIRIDRSTGTRNRALASKIFKRVEAEIECGAYAKPTDPTFATAALGYMKWGGERKFLAPIIEHFGETALKLINQDAIDKAADAICPGGSAVLRTRTVYTPISAVLRHAGIHIALRRPKGGRGEARPHWLRPDQAFDLIASARARAERLAVAIEHGGPSQFRGARRKAALAARRYAGLLVFLLYTGCRLSEALRVQPKEVELDREFCFCGKTKNGLPRGVHLPPPVVAELANFTWGKDRVFGVDAKCGRLYTWLDEVAEGAGIEIPDGVAYHIFRHTYGAWCRRYGKLDTAGLVATGAWRSQGAARIYEHVDVTEAAKASNLFPTAKSTATGGKPE